MTYLSNFNEHASAVLQYNLERFVNDTSDKTSVKDKHSVDFWFHYLMKLHYFERHFSNNIFMPTKSVR